MPGFAKRVDYGPVLSSDGEETGKFGTILIDEFKNNMEESFTEHTTLDLAHTDAKERSDLYRKLFSQSLNIVNNNVQLLED